ncbi:hypothetical protein RA307_23690 [Xanthobacteraceae bacterium Astr-EGSB]|uniref:hypothetical protein n=1 Tax=Astrobacterium formosum TaxID=3069710 RepID=UPI0027B26921|nr:hypothetical protein [Xanthobacteraceae bacterium Astr-EGSB]
MAVLVNAAPGVVVYLESINASSSPAYLKIFDSVQVPSCAGQPAAIIPILAAAGGAPAWAKRQTSIDLKAGVAFCIVGAVDDGDVSAPPPGVVINLRYK